jgi:hypothetical protein
MKSSGEFLLYLDESAVVDLVRTYPERFFDGNVWDVSYSDIGSLDESIVAEVRQRLKGTFVNCLEDCASYLRYQEPEPMITYRARASVDFLTQKLK